MMSETMHTDFELVSDINLLVEKYGVERICNCIDYVKDIEKNKEVIIVLKKIEELINKKTNKNSNSINYSEKEEYNSILKLLNDKNIFPNVKSLQNFYRLYNFKDSSFKNKKDKIYGFTQYIFNNKLIDLNKVIDDIYFIKDNEIKYDKNENQLKKWTELIIDEKK